MYDPVKDFWYTWGWRSMDTCPRTLDKIEVQMEDTTVKEAFYVSRWNATPYCDEGWYHDTPSMNDVPLQREPVAWRPLLSPLEREHIQLRMTLNFLVSEVRGLVGAFGTDIRKMVGDMNVDALEGYAATAQRLLDSSTLFHDGGEAATRWFRNGDPS